MRLLHTRPHAEPGSLATRPLREPARSPEGAQMRSPLGLVLAAVLAVGAFGCGRQALVSTDALPLKRVVLYRNGVGYFERSGHVESTDVRFKMRGSEVGDFLATLAVMERGGSSVRAAAFPLDDDDQDGEDAKPRNQMTEDERKGLKTVDLSLDGKKHDLQVGYVAESPVWKPSYRLVVRDGGQADLQAWGIVQNLSGEDWKNVRLSLVAGAPLAFEAQLGVAVIPPRPTVTDTGEVIAAVPKSETTLAQRDETRGGRAPATGAPADEAGEGDMDDQTAVAQNKPTGHSGGYGRGAGGLGGAAGPRASASTRAPSRRLDVAKRKAMQAEAPPPPPEAVARAGISAPRNLRSLAAVAMEGGATRYDLPMAVTIPDKSATMVLLTSRQVHGEAIFLFAPDGGVADSMTHPFRVARFVNETGGVLERGPIAVFQQGSFLGQGMVDPLPSGATATVPFALERAIAVEQERKYDEVGARIAKIENAQLWVERDAVTQTKYRIRNGGNAPAKVLVKHPRQSGTRLYQPPKGTEDNVGTGSALVPIQIDAHKTAELVVDERQTTRRFEDWFSTVADNAVKAYLADSRADKKVAANLSAAWGYRDQIVALREARGKFAQEQVDLQNQTQETRRNLRAIEKNKSAAGLRAKLTARLGEMATRLDEITKHVVEIDSKLAELGVRFREAVREIKVEQPLPPKP